MAGMDEPMMTVAEGPEDQVMRESIAMQADRARGEAQRLERLARSQRNIEAACHAALEQLDRGLKAQEERESAQMAEGIVVAEPALARTFPIEYR